MCIPKWALLHNKINAKTDKWKYSDTEATLIFVANWSKGSNFNLPTVQKIICLEIHGQKQTQRANLHQITFNTWTWKHFVNSHVCYCYKDYKFSISPKWQLYFLHEYGWGLLSGQCLTEKPGIILIQVQIPSAAKDFSPRANFQCRLSYSVHTALVCNCMHQHLCAC